MTREQKERHRDFFETRDFFDRIAHLRIAHRAEFDAWDGKAGTFGIDATMIDVHEDAHGWGVARGAA